MIKEEFLNEEIDLPNDWGVELDRDRFCDGSQGCRHVRPTISTTWVKDYGRAPIKLVVKSERLVSFFVFTIVYSNAII